MAHCRGTQAMQKWYSTWYNISQMAAYKEPGDKFGISKLGKQNKDSV